MEHEKNEEVIFVRDLLFATLYQWRRILTIALIFALIFGGVATVTEYQKKHNAPSQATIQAALDEYVDEKDILTKELKKAEKQLQLCETYLAESILMNADAFSLYRANLMLVVDVPEGTEYASAVLRSYLMYLNDNALLEDAAQTLCINATYLSELIKIEQNEQNPRSVLITITYPSKDGANQLLTLIKKHMELSSNQIIANIGQHTMGMVVNQIFPCIDTDIASKQQAALQQLESLKNAVAEAENNLANLQEPVFTNATFSKKTVLIFAVIGALFGGIAVAVVACLMHIAGATVYSARVLKNKIGLNLLGVIPSSNKKNIVDKWLLQLEGRATDPAQAQVTLSTAYNYCKNGVRLLVLGDCKGKQQTVADKLKDMGVEIVAAGNLLCNADTVASLPACDAVLLVEECDTSRYANVMQTLSLVSDQKKPIIGFILFEK